jgi:hypothetical protein
LGSLGWSGQRLLPTPVLGDGESASAKTQSVGNLRPDCTVPLNWSDANQKILDKSAASPINTSTGSYNKYSKRRVCLMQVFVNQYKYEATRCKY